MAMAGGNGATTFTQTDHAVAESFPSPNPCTLDPGTVSDVHNDVFHGTINKTGSPPGQMLWVLRRCFRPFVRRVLSVCIPSTSPRGLSYLLSFATAIWHQSIRIDAQMRG
jgi:hypothetical protein